MSSQRDGRPRPRRPVGTHDLCVRPRHPPHVVLLSSPSSLQDSVTASIKSEGRTLCERLQHRDLTGTDALRLDTLVRLYTEFCHGYYRVIVRPSPSSPRRRPVFVLVIPHTSSCFRPVIPHTSSCFRPVIPTSSCFRPVIPTSHRPVGTHDLCVRCVKSYSIVVLTGMDALRLDTSRD